MNINDFPQAIYEANLEVIAKQAMLERYDIDKARLDYEIELVVSDELLRNEQMRKAKRLELQQEPHYRELLEDIADYKKRFRKAQNKLELLNNQFRIAKLQMQLEIAKFENLSVV